MLAATGRPRRGHSAVRHVDRAHNSALLSVQAAETQTAVAWSALIAAEVARKQLAAFGTHLTGLPAPAAVGTATVPAMSRALASGQKIVVGTCPCQWSPARAQTGVAGS